MVGAVTVPLPTDLVEEIDRERGLVKRATYVAVLIRKARNAGIKVFEEDNSKKSPKKAKEMKE